MLIVPMPLICRWFSNQNCSHNWNSEKLVVCIQLSQNTTSRAVLSLCKIKILWTSGSRLNSATLWVSERHKRFQSTESSWCEDNSPSASEDPCSETALRIFLGKINICNTQYCCKSFLCAPERHDHQNEITYLVLCILTYLWCGKRITNIICQSECNLIFRQKRREGVLFQHEKNCTNKEAEYLPEKVVFHQMAEASAQTWKVTFPLCDSPEIEAWPNAVDEPDRAATHWRLKNGTA